MKGIILAGGIGWLHPQDVMRSAAYAIYLRRRLEEYAA
jgi:hypothetical protein